MKDAPKKANKAASGSGHSLDDLPGIKWLRKLKKIMKWSFSLCFFGAAAFVVFLLFLRAQALPVSTILQTTEIVDLHGDLIDSFYHGQNRQLVPLESISPNLINATLSIEDHRFYEHHGFDYKGLTRAVLVDVQQMAKVQGASTLTQQLARNLYLTHERTWTRKIKEAYYTIQLEMQYSKQEILDMYLNQIYYGHAAYGIQSASRLFFGKDARDLTLAESAMLAGIPKGPKYYSPFMDMENAKDRQHTVLQSMTRYNYITPQQAEAAFAEPLQYKKLTGDPPSVAPYFRDYVKQMAIERLGVTESQFNEGGYKIYTTLDLRAQKIAEDTVAKYIDGSSEIQGALIAIDPRNGYIKAMVGGKNYKENQYNRALAKTRQPGSSFKVFVYLTALQQQGFSAVTKYKSEPTAFTYDNGRKTYMPSNFNDHYAHDFIDLRQAIAESDNIYAVQTIMNIGPEKVIETARKLGIDSPLKPLPSLALGTFPVSPLEMASAFGVIANQGLRVKPSAITRIEDGKGKILYEAHPTQEQVVDSSYTYVLTNLLESVFEPGGTGSRVASKFKRPAAGKTGTTDTDAWMVGYTPELATAVWVGYDRDRNISAVESHEAAPIFAEFTEQTLEPIPPKIFPIPDGVVSIYIDPETGKKATVDCPNTRLETFIKGTEPADYCTLHGETPIIEETGQTGGPEENKERSWWDDLKHWWND